MKKLTWWWKFFETEQVTTLVLAAVEVEVSHAAESQEKEEQREVGEDVVKVGVVMDDVL